MTSIPKVSLGELLTLERRPVVLIADQMYAEIGTYSFGRGIFHKTPRTGAEVGDKKLFVIKEGDFILQITFAWEGAVALASKAEEGMYGSVRFLTFRVNESRCLPQYLVYYFRTRRGLDQLGNISPGSAGRNRVLSLKRISEVNVPLPPIVEQHRIVARIEELSAKIEGARKLRGETTVEINALARDATAHAFPRASDRVVGDLMGFQTGYAFKSEWFTNEGIRLVRNANVGHGNLDWSETERIPAERRKEFYRFELQSGDILITLDRPIISTGVKVARVREEDLPCLLLQRVARVQFKTESVLPEYFYSWLRSPHFIDAIDPGRSNGVPHISHKDIEKIPFAVPPLSEQRRIVAYLNDLQAKVDTLKKLQVDTAEELDALMPSILSRAFSGAL